MTITSLLSLSLLLASSLAFTTLPKRLSLSPQCHQRKKTHLPTRKIHLSELCYSWGEEDSAASAQPLPYSPKDLERLAELKTREITIPIVILDSILPGQKLYYQSSDPKFGELINYVLASNSSEIGLIGMNPHTGNPLNIGVTAPLTKRDITFGITRHSERIMATAFKGQRRFLIVGEPWMDSTQSFYLANVEIVDNRFEIMPHNLEEQAYEIHQKIPALVEEWVDWVVKTGLAKPADMSKRMKEIGPMPESLQERANWIGALVNPIRPLGVCVEIRPAMLACRNDHDRLVLASTALRSSIDHLSGKRKLF